MLRFNNIFFFSNFFWRDYWQITQLIQQGNFEIRSCFIIIMNLYASPWWRQLSQAVLRFDRHNFRSNFSPKYSSWSARRQSVRFSAKATMRNRLSTWTMKKKKKNDFMPMIFKCFTTQNIFQTVLRLFCFKPHAFSYGFPLHAFVTCCY